MRIREKSKDAVSAEVLNGRYPPVVYYQVLFTRVAEQRPVPAFWRAELLGADVNLFFICNIKQEEGTYVCSLFIAMAIPETSMEKTVVYISS